VAAKLAFPFSAFFTLYGSFETAKAATSVCKTTWSHDTILTLFAAGGRAHQDSVFCGAHLEAYLPVENYDLGRRRRRSHKVGLLLDWAYYKRRPKIMDHAAHGLSYMDPTGAPVVVFCGLYKTGLLARWMDKCKHMHS
jgi:hypothetical protein